MIPLPAALAWCVLQVTLLTAFVAAWCLLLRRSGPATRSLAVFTGLALIVLLTFSSFAPWPRWSGGTLVTLPREPIDNRSESVTRPIPSNAPRAEFEQTAVTESIAPLSTDVPAPSPATLFWESLVAELQAPAPMAVDARWTWPRILATAVFIGAAVGLVRLLVGLILVRSYRTRSRAISDPGLLELRDVLQAELNCPQPIELFESELLATAATVGWRKPFVLLPKNWREWSDDERRAVLAHEIAHIQRHDFLTWVAAQGALVLHFYHPLVHWLCGRLRLEQELAADAAAARLAGGQQTYLATLAAMALRQSDRPVAWPARTFLPTRGTFLRRIEMLRDTKLGSTTTSVGVRVGTVGVLLAVGLAISGLRGGSGPTTSKAVAADQKSGVVAASNNATHDADIGLEYVPRDAVVVATVRPAALLARPEFASLAKAQKERENNNQGFGIALDRIEQATIAFLPTTDEPVRSPFDLGCLILRVKQAEDLVAVRQSHFPNAVEQEYGNRKYFKIGAHGFLLADERTIVRGREPTLRRAIVANSTGGANRAKLSAAWSDVGAQPGALLVNLEQIRGLLNNAPEISRLDAGWLSVFSPLWKNADTAVLGLKAEKSLTLEGALHSDSAKSANLVRETLSAAVTLAKNGLSQGRARAAQMSDVNGAALLVAADVAESILDGLKIDQSQNEVRFSTSIPEKELAIAVSLLLPAVTNARAAAGQVEAKNNLKQLGLALHNFHDVHKHFPPAVFYGLDGKSKYPHSWRVAILPFVDQAALYNQYRFDEPWDGENNKKILAQIPSIFRDPNAPADTTNSSYFALVDHPSFGRVVRAPGTATAFSSAKGTQMGEIVDGTSNVLLVVEAQRDIPWTKPEDIPYAADQPLPKFGGHAPDGFFALFCDGRVDFISDKIDEKTLRRLITMNDGEPVNFEKFINRDRRPVARPGVVR